jgi:hypothetical protein
VWFHDITLRWASIFAHCNGRFNGPSHRHTKKSIFVFQQWHYTSHRYVFSSYGFESIASQPDGSK